MASNTSTRNLNILVTMQWAGQRGARQTKQGLDQAAKGAGGLLDAWKAIKAAAITGVLIGIGQQALQLGQQMVQLGSDAQEMQGKFDVVFGQEAGRVTESLDAFAEAVGRNKFELRGFAANLGDTFKPLGFSIEQAAQLSDQVTKLAVDLASFNNLNEADVAAALQSALVGNTENLQQFGVVAQEAQVKAKALELGLYDGKGAVDAYAKAQAILQLTLEGTTDAQGDALRTADSWANRQRALTAALQETGAEIGQELIPVLIPMLEAFTDVAKDAAPALINSFKILAPVLQDQVEKWAEFFRVFAQGVENLIIVGQGIDLIKDRLGSSVVNFVPLVGGMEALKSITGDAADEAERLETALAARQNAPTERGGRGNRAASLIDLQEQEVNSRAAAVGNLSESLRNVTTESQRASQAFEDEQYAMREANRSTEEAINAGLQRAQALKEQQAAEEAYREAVRARAQAVREAVEAARTDAFVSSGPVDQLFAAQDAQMAALFQNDAIAAREAEAEIVAAQQNISNSYKQTAADIIIAQEGVNQKTVSYLVQIGLLTPEQGKAKLAYAETTAAITELANKQAFLSATVNDQVEATQLLTLGYASTASEALILAGSIDGELSASLQGATELTDTLRNQLDAIAGDTSVRVGLSVSGLDQLGEAGRQLAAINAGAQGGVNPETVGAGSAGQSVTNNNTFNFEGDAETIEDVLASRGVTG